MESKKKSGMKKTVREMRKWVAAERFLNKVDGLKEGISSVACVRLGWCDRVKGVGNAVWKWVSRLNSKSISGWGIGRF